jgi:coenzyme F420-0:L-glutamate ligase/coenzyme F420-1:gamma-L-glutamate ligase
MSVEVLPVPGIPEIDGGDDLGALLADALERAGLPPREGDVVVVTQKVVSKAEGRVVPEPPGGRPAVVRNEAVRIVAERADIVIAETRHGFVCANAGVDASNVEPGYVTVLPADPDASAERLREGLSDAFGCAVAVIVSDTFGRPWREGVVNVALGVAGLRPLIDYRGRSDTYGRPLTSTVIALADELAGAAEIITRKSAGTPVAVARGAAEWVGEGNGRMLIRDASRDLFR